MKEKLSIREINNIEYAKIMLKKLLDNQSVIMEELEQNENYPYILHVIAHRDAFARLESHTKYHGQFSNDHDIEKIGLALILGKEKAKTIHKKIAAHHNIDWNNPDDAVLTEKMFDWESCHYTKIDIKYTAYEYATENHKAEMPIIMPKLKELSFWENKNTSPLTKEGYDKIITSLHKEHIISEIRKSYAYLKENF